MYFTFIFTTNHNAFILVHSQSERDIICHNLVFLHVNYNTFRVVYWCMYKLMEDQTVMAAVRKEVDEVVEAKRTGASASEYEAEFTTEDINKLPVVGKYRNSQSSFNRIKMF